MVSEASWRYSFYKAYAAIFYHYFNEIKPLFPEATFSFKRKRHFGYKKKKRKQFWNRIQHRTSRKFRKAILNVTKDRFLNFGTANRTIKTLSYTHHYV